MQRWVDPSVVSFHVEVMLSISFGYQVARLEERWMNVWGDYRVPVQLVEPKHLGF